MTALAQLPVPADEVGERFTKELLAAITPEFAAMVRWVPSEGMLVFPQDHPTLGWRMCCVAGCGKARSSADGICTSCHARWKRSGRPDIEEFIATPKTYVRAVGVQICRVHGCERPWKSKGTQLCLAHEVQKRNLGTSLDTFLALPDLKPHTSLGPCLVAACLRERAGRGFYCLGHYNHWKKAGQLPGIDEEHWRVTAPAIAEDNRISLRGLPLRVAAEIVYGIQQRSRAGFKTHYNVVRPLADTARRLQVSTINEVPPKNLNRSVRGLRNELCKNIELLHLTPESERLKDVWNLAVFGHRGTLRFTEISHAWLREGAKRWAFDELPRRRGNGVSGTVQAKVNGIVQLSESLRLQRPDRGDDLRSLSRADITAFCNRLAYLQSQEVFSAFMRSRHAYAARQVLARMRTMGLTRPGEPLHGLPDDFTLTREDMPDTPEDQQAGRDLPAEVIQHLCANLNLLTGSNSAEVRTAIELLIDTGRRPDEICRLPWDCLSRDQDGKPVLVYDNHKAHRLGRRLPIPEATAAVIGRQQVTVRARFPDTSIAELRLLPSPVANREGHKAVSENWVSYRHRTWVDSLPDITVPTVVEIDGQLTTKMLPFDKRRIIPYAYRHSFAQRYADAGVAPDVLMQLMDHREMSTTQSYYRVGEKRRRAAVERVTTMQFDRHGNRIWLQAKVLLDSEHARRAIGEVAVPYGVCTEPSNVAAAGQDCPVRFRCVGCGHFRTDVSYLPDLEAYLADLLRNRERLLSAVDADNWAKREAMPSDEEITRVRRLIGRVKTELDKLGQDEHAQIREAVAIVRRARNGVVGLGLPRIRQPLPDVRVERTA